MVTIQAFLLISIAFSASGFRFPTQDENMLIAITEYSDKVRFFDPSDGPNARLKKYFRLQGNGWNSATYALDFNYNEGLIYYTDLVTEKVYSLAVATGEVSTIYSGGLGSPEGIAYDWIHGNLYVSDWLKGKIRVINPKTGSSKVILELTNLRDLEVDPINGWLYFTKSDENMSTLRRTSLDGQHEEILLNLTSARGLSIDYDDQKLYVVETRPAYRISSVDFDGSNKRILYTETSGFYESPDQVTSFRDKFYWTTTMFSKVKSKKKNGGERVTYTGVAAGFDTIGGILAVHPSRQPDGENKCGENNGGCSHFCLPVKYSLQESEPYTCACPDGMTLTMNNRTCFAGN